MLAGRTGLALGLCCAGWEGWAGLSVPLLVKPVFKDCLKNVEFSKIVTGVAPLRHRKNPNIFLHFSIFISRKWVLVFASRGVRFTMENFVPRFIPSGSGQRRSG